MLFAPIYKPALVRSLLLVWIWNLLPQWVVGFFLLLVQCWGGLALTGHLRTASGLIYWLVLICLQFRATATKRISWCSCVCSPHFSSAVTSAVTHLFPRGAGKQSQIFITFQRGCRCWNTIFHFYCYPSTWLVKSHQILSSKTLLRPSGTVPRRPAGPQGCHMVSSPLGAYPATGMGNNKQLRDISEDKSHLQA